MLVVMRNTGSLVLPEKRILWSSKFWEHWLNKIKQFCSLQEFPEPFMLTMLFLDFSFFDYRTFYPPIPLSYTGSIPGNVFSKTCLL